MKTLICIIIMVLSVNALAQDAWVPVEGKVKVAKEPLSDPAPDGNQVAYVSIRGEGAKKIFIGMTNYKDVPNACGETNVVARIVGDVMCFKRNESYTCEFGIRLNDGAIRLGRTC